MSDTYAGPNVLIRDDEIELIYAYACGDPALKALRARIEVTLKHKKEFGNAPTE